MIAGPFARKGKYRGSGKERSGLDQGENKPHARVPCASCHDVVLCGKSGASFHDVYLRLYGRVHLGERYTESEGTCLRTWFTAGPGSAFAISTIRRNHSRVKLLRQMPLAKTRDARSTNRSRSGRSTVQASNILTSIILPQIRFVNAAAHVRG